MNCWDMRSGFIEGLYLERQVVYVGVCMCVCMLMQPTAVS